MGCKELIESLRTVGDERLKALRQDAEREAELIRAETAEKIEALRADFTRQRSLATARDVETLLAEVNRTVKRIRIKGERSLAARLYSLAYASLNTLRDSAYPEIFAALVLELPAFGWQMIRVNPQDLDLAKSYFPGVEIVADEGIAGGLETVSEGDQVRVVNTFEKRLERIWEDILPDIMREIKDVAL